jgi:hypothetical protein
LIRFIENNIYQLILIYNLINFYLKRIFFFNIYNLKEIFIYFKNINKFYIKKIFNAKKLDKKLSSFKFILREVIKKYLYF